MPTAREEILSRIRAATKIPSAPSRTVSSSEVGLQNASAIAAQYSSISRDYKLVASIPREAILGQLEDRLRDYDAGVYHATAETVPETIAHVLSSRDKRRIAIPTGIPAAWFTPGIAFIEDDRAGINQIDSCDGVLTTATLAIAETGTIVLQDVPRPDVLQPDVAGQGRRALSLLPDYHLCVVEAAKVVQTVPEAIALLQTTAALATTFFSGPSATADIEMTRIKGVHGPRFVDVILLTYPA